MIELIAKKLVNELEFLSFRSCSRQIYAAVDLLFEHRYLKSRHVVMSCSTSLQQLIDISRSPRKLAVKELHISADFVTIGKAHYDTSTPISQERTVNYLMDQDFFRRTGKDLAMLAEAMRNLPRCESIYVLQLPWTRRGDYWERLIYGHCGSDNALFSVSRPEEDFNDDECTPGSHLHTTDNETNISEVSTATVCSVIAAIADTGATPLNLVLSLMSTGPHALFIPSDLALTYYASLSRLKRLEVIHNSDQWKKSILSVQWSCAMSRFLSCLTELEEFRLSGSYFHSSIINDLWMEALCCDNLQNLKYLDLSWLRLAAFTPIIKLLSHVGRNLQQLKLSQLAIPDSYFPDIADYACIGLACPNAAKIVISNISTYQKRPELRRVKFLCSLDSVLPIAALESPKYSVLKLEGQYDINYWLSGMRLKVFYLGYVLRRP